MRNLLKARLLAVTCLLLLSACGGNSVSSGDGVAPQVKALSRSAKTSAGSSAGDYQNVVEALYVGYFGRPADPTGLSNFEGALLAAGAPTDIQGVSQAYATSNVIKALIDSFGSSAESQALYGSGNTQAFVTSVFQNVLGRAPLTAGLNYWTSAIDGGSLSRGDAALSIMAGALGNATDQGELDAQLIDNRLAAAAYFTAQVTSQNEVGDYKGASAAAGARSLLSGITAATNTASYQAAMASGVASLKPVPGISAFAGNTGYYGPTATLQVQGAQSMVMDASGNTYILYDSYVAKMTPAGVVTTFAGKSGVTGAADGMGTAATFNYPAALAIDPSGNIDVFDYGNALIRKITPAGMVSTVAGTLGKQGTVNGVGAEAQFQLITSMAFDGSGKLYLAESGSNTIRVMSPNYVVTTLAGSPGVTGSADGPGPMASFNAPSGIAVDAEGNVYVGDSSNMTVRKITPSGVVSTLAGKAGVAGTSDGTGSAASFGRTCGIGISPAQILVVSDCANEAIREVTLAGVVTTLAGKPGTSGFANGTGSAALFQFPSDVTLDAAGNAYVFDQGQIREITPAGTVSTYAGPVPTVGSADGIGTSAGFHNPTGMVFDSAGNLFVADTGNDLIRKVSPGGVVTLVAGYVGAPVSRDGTAGHSGTAADAAFDNPLGMAIDSAGNLYVTDVNSNVIRKMTPAGLVTTIAGTAGVSGYADGTGAAAKFNQPSGMAVDSAGNVYVADLANYVIRKITPAGVVTTFAGTAQQFGVGDGVGAAARFVNPYGMTIDAAGNLYVTDHHAVRKITPQGAVSTVAGSNNLPPPGISTPNGFVYAKGIAVDAAGNLYVCDSIDNTLSKVTQSGLVTIVAGVSNSQVLSLGNLPGNLNYPEFVTIDKSGVLYVTTANAIVKVRLQ